MGNDTIDGLAAGVWTRNIGRESGTDAIHEFLETKSTWISYAEGPVANPFILR